MKGIPIVLHARTAGYVLVTLNFFVTLALLQESAAQPVLTTVQLWEAMQSPVDAGPVVLGGRTFTLTGDLSPASLSRAVELQGPGTLLVTTTNPLITSAAATAALRLSRVTVVYATSRSTFPLRGPLPFVNTTSLPLQATELSVSQLSGFGLFESAFWQAPDVVASLRNASASSGLTGAPYTSAAVLSIAKGNINLTASLLIPSVGACFSGADIFAYDSASLKRALSQSIYQSIYVTQDIQVSATDFFYQRPVNLTGRSVLLYGCNSLLDLNYNYTRHSVCVGPGAVLQLTGLSFINSPVMNQLFWPKHLPALLGWVDVEPQGQCWMSSCNITSPDPSSLSAYLSTLANRTRADGLPSEQLSFTAYGPSEALISSWTLSGTNWISSPGIPAGAAAATMWKFTGVWVKTEPPRPCMSSKGVPGVRVSSGRQLRQVIGDPLIPSIEIVDHITFLPTEWPPEVSGPDDGQIFVNNGTYKEIYACHPVPGERYTINFGDLGQMVFVFGTLVFRGTLLLTNPHASARRSWLYLLVGALSVETDGVILFEGLEIDSFQPSPFDNAEDPFWETPCGSLCPSFIPNRANYRNTTYYDAFIYDYKFMKTDWVKVSQGRNITGAGFWGYTDVALTWRPRQTGGGGGSGGDGVAVAAIAVPVAVGGALLIAGVVGLAFWIRRRNDKASAAAPPAKDAETGDVPVVVKSGPAEAGSDGRGDSGAGFLGPAPNSTTVLSHANSVLSGSVPTEVRIEDMKRVLTSQSALAATTRMDQIMLMDLLGEGTFGKVYRGTWRGTTVAVKTMVFPSNMSGKEKREKMAVMETAISSSLSHPNIVQTYTYAVLPVKGDTSAPKLDAGHSVTVDSTSPLALMSAAENANVHSWEVRLVLEFCDRGSLRDLLAVSLDNWPGAAAAGGAHATPDPQPGSQPDTSFSQQPLQQKEEQQEHGSGEGGAAGSAAAPVSGGGSGNGPMGLPGPVLEPGSAAAGEGSTGAALGDSICPLGYAAVLDTCLDVARAMLHMHSESIVHGDLKARNILLKSGTAGDGRNYVAKVADFGLSLRIDPHETHVSNVYQGTITHMAPECLLHGKVSKMSDVYAFGILMWETFTAGQAFKGVPRALLGHEVTKMNRRPEFPFNTPFEYQLLACRCWESDPSIRPDFEQIIRDLTRMRAKLAPGSGPAMAPSLVPSVPPTPAPAAECSASISMTAGATQTVTGSACGLAPPSSLGLHELIYVQDVDGSSTMTASAAVGFTPMSMSAPGGVRGAGPAVVGPAMGPIRLGLAPAMPPILEAQGGSNHMGGEGSGSATGHVGT